MAENDANDNGSAVANGENGAMPGMPAMRVLAQYVKDLSFENPNAPASFQEGEQPKVELQLDVGAKRTEDTNVFEVTLQIRAKSERKDQVMFLIELVYAGLFQFANIPEADYEPLLFIECPRTLFPFARQMIAELSQNGGYFPPLLVDPVDFASLFMAQRAQAGQQPANA